MATVVRETLESMDQIACTVFLIQSQAPAERYRVSQRIYCE